MKKLLLLSTAIWLIAACSGGQQSEEGSETTTSESTEPEEATATADNSAQMEAGAKVYNQYCMVCHQGNGQGVQGAFPTLVQTEWVLGDDTRLITTIIQGLQGEITVKGETYNAVMPQHGFLDDEQIAGVLTYVRNSFGNEAPAISADAVAEVRDSLQSEDTSTN